MRATKTLMAILIIMQLILPFWQPVFARVMENNVASYSIPICTAVGIAYVDPAEEGKHDPKDYTPNYHSPLVLLDKDKTPMGTLPEVAPVLIDLDRTALRLTFSVERTERLDHAPYLSRDPPFIA